MEKAPEEQKTNMMWFGDDCMDVLNSTKGNMPNDLNGYLNLMGEMKSYGERYKDCPGVDKKFYENFMDVVNNLETELKKYK